jgi:hypothetical protein
MPVLVYGSAESCTQPLTNRRTDLRQFAGLFSPTESADGRTGDGGLVDGI